MRWAVSVMSTLPSDPNARLPTYHIRCGTSGQENKFELASAAVPVEYRGWSSIMYGRRSAEYARWCRRLQQPDVRSACVACWQPPLTAHHATTSRGIYMSNPTITTCYLLHQRFCCVTKSWHPSLLLASRSLAGEKVIERLANHSCAYRFKVEDAASGLISSPCAAWACIRLDRLQTGYRFIHLMSPKGNETSGVLLVHVMKKLR